MSDFVAALSGLGPALGAHLLLSMAALALGAAIALPLIGWGARNAHVARGVLGFAGLVQTIPTLALLALFYPLLLGLDALVGGVPALGFLPALLALALYALLPIVRNGVTAIREIDPAVREAAAALGMTGRQKLAWVEAPIAAPLVMAGIRTAAVWTIGAATLATMVGASSLGDPIFAGLQTQNWTLVLAGCLASAGLALAADLALGLVASGMAGRRRGRIAAGAGAAVLALGIALLPWRAGVPWRGGERPVMVVGAKNFTEQYVLAQLIGSRLEEAGYAVEYRSGLGSAVIFRALSAGDIDVYVDYAGTLWSSEMAREDRPPRAAMLAELRRWLDQPGGAALVGPLGFENAYAFAMKRGTARALGIATLADLARVSPRLTLGTDLEFLARPEWAGVRAAYPMAFAETRRFAPAFLYRALASDAADAITAFSSDGRIAADGLTVLADPRQAIPAYDALLLASPRCEAEARCMAALRPLVGAIPVEAMRAANHSVDRANGKRSPAEAAATLAKAAGL